MPLNQFVVKPGYDKQNSEVGAVARWIDGNNVRFRYGLPEKVGGWAAKGSTTLNAVSRKLFPFRDNSGNKYLAIGMDKFLLIYFEGNFYDITPFRSSGYPPTIDEFALSTFTTVSGSNSVTITTTSINKISVGDIVEFENVSLPAGTGYNNSDFEDKLFEVKTTPTSTTFTVQLTGNASGNAGTATKLATARTIGGVSFNGSANIDLPGVNTAGNQDTTGNAATATTAGTVTTAAQPNITSLGTLTTLAIDGISIDGNNITATRTNDDIVLTPSGTGQVQVNGNITATNVTGTLQTAAQTNITSVGTLTGLTVSADATINGHRVGRGGNSNASNVAVGDDSLENNTTGTNNTAVGNDALRSNTTGADNTAVGHNTLTVNTTASSNTAVGRSVLSNNTTGEFNTAIGRGSLFTNTTADANTAVGAYALTAQTTGSQNCALGEAAGISLTTANGCVFLGTEAGSGQVTTGNHQLYIARDNVAVSNAAVWIYGNNAGACHQGNNSSSWSTTSDQRLKKDIVANTVGLSIIDNVTVKNFKYKQYSDGSPVSSDDTVDMSEFPNADGVHQVLIGQGKTETQIGIIAQELEAVAPTCVTTNDRGVKTVDTDELFWYMLNAIKELSTKVKALEAG